MSGYNRVGLTPTKEIITPYLNVNLDILDAPSSYDSEGNLGFTYQFQSFDIFTTGDGGEDGYIDAFLFSVNPYKVNSVEATVIIWNQGIGNENIPFQNYIVGYKATWNTPNLSPPYEESFSQESLIYLSAPQNLPEGAISILTPYGAGPTSTASNNLIGIKYLSNGSETLEFRCKVKVDTIVRGIYEVI